MGYAVSWVAIRGKSPDAICEELGLSRTGKYENVPDSPIVGAELRGGWYLVWGNDAGFTDNLLLNEISEGAEAVGFVVEEHVGACGAKGWNNGAEIWSIDNFQDLVNLDAKGHLPAEFAEIRDQLLKEQEEAGGNKAKVDHVFSTLVELARALTGFAYDQAIPGTTDEDDPFEILKVVEGTPLAGWEPRRGGWIALVVFLLFVIGTPVVLVGLACAGYSLLRWLWPAG